MLRRPPLLLLLAAGCATGVGDPAEAPGIDARVLALSTYEASLGSVIEAYGTGFPAPELGRIELTFSGSYRHAAGSEAVDLTVPVRRIDAGTLRWTTFGPYAVPFGSGNRIGTFEGTVRVRVTTEDGTALLGRTETPIVLRVLPSIVVRDLQPVAATCGTPAARVIGGLPYRFQVEALGFVPESFTYSLSAPSLGWNDSVRRVASGAVDSIDRDDALVFPEVPAELPAYGVIVSVEGRAMDGTLHQTVFAMAVHRPMEVYYNGNVDIGEVYAPLPVSGCIPGGEAGRDAAYMETMSETRSRTYGVSWNENWLRSHTVGSSTSTMVTRTETNAVDFSTTDGQIFRWSAGAEGGGQVTLFGLVELGMKLNGSIGQEFSHSETASVGRTSGLSVGTTTTDSEEVSESEGGSAGEDFRWEVSSTDQIARDFRGRVIAGTYGVFYRQTLRLVRRAALVTYSLCGAAEVVGEVDFQDWTWSTDLALGEQCPPLPRSNLPDAQCVVEPCAGE